MDNLYSFSQSSLTELLSSWGQPRFRSQQIWSWLYERGVDDISDMTDLPRKLRQKLEGSFKLGELKIELEQNSEDGTQKRLYRLHDEKLIESVLMKYADGRRTACISSQAGCAMGCVFCATGQMGFQRQLAAYEIFEQAQLFSRQLKVRGERLSNIVLMGMGEPFHNYDAVIESIHMIMERLGIGARRITVSTVGLVPKILRFAKEGLQVKLAVSLHSVSNAKRSAIMPVNRKYPVEDLISACRKYIDATNRRITFEWALIAEENDTEEEATQLARRIRSLKCHVNVIPLNPTGGYLGLPSQNSSVDKFVQILNDHGIPATVRMRRGIDIDAGCGQLRSKVDR